MRCLDGITDSMGMNLNKLQELVWTGVLPGMLQSVGSQRIGHNWATELNLEEGTTALKSSHKRNSLPGVQWQEGQGPVSAPSTQL